MGKLRFLTAGESHGRGLVGILEGMPAGLKLSIVEIQEQLKRRKLGFGRGARQIIESDRVEILSGIRFGKTLGSPISLLIWNQDWEEWKTVMQIESPEPASYAKVEIPRPGHADWVGGLKYRHSDFRNVLERASARETAMRVALGALARQFLEQFQMKIESRVVRIGRSVDLQRGSWDVEGSLVRCSDPETSRAMVKEIQEAQEKGDTLGGEFEVQVTGMPLGLGSYVQWDRRLEGQLTQALMSLNAIKGVEVGAGFQSASQMGSEVQDSWGQIGQTLSRLSNHAGGIEGGMSTGQSLVIRLAMKPLATLKQPLKSIHPKTHQLSLAHVERSDICAVPAAGVVAEAIVALVLADSLLDQLGGDSMEIILERFQAWQAGCCQ